MSETKRLHVMFVVGSNQVSADDIKEVVGALTHLIGGVTVTQCQGTWAENGAVFGEDNYGKFETEQAWRIDATIVPDSEVLAMMIECFDSLHGKAEWIHCETWSTLGLHFKV